MTNKTIVVSNITQCPTPGHILEKLERQRPAVEKGRTQMSAGTPPYTDSAIGELARKFPRFVFKYSENYF
jgi:hypothetical protein